LADGDPIFSAVSSVRARGVHVIQHAPTSDALELETWVDQFGEEGRDDVIDQLVISCALSDEAAAEARRLMRSWIVFGKLPDSAQPKTANGSGPERAGDRPKGKRGRRAS
jgi:hypothetical protein